MSQNGGIRARWHVVREHMPTFFFDVLPMWGLALLGALAFLHFIDRIAAGIAERELTGSYVVEREHRP